MEEIAFCSEKSLYCVRNASSGTATSSAARLDLALFRTCLQKYNEKEIWIIFIFKPRQLCWAGFIVMLMCVCVCVCVSVCLLTRYLKNYFTNQLHFWWGPPPAPGSDVITFLQKSARGTGGCGGVEIWP